MDITFGFIIIRHVNSEKTDQYWKRCYECIRKFYPDHKIVIIDDNSNYEFVRELNYPITNCEIIHSEFPGRGELLPYYYYYHNKFFDKAIILHDSMFINKEINIDTIQRIDKVIFLWHFLHQWDSIYQQKQIIQSSILRFKHDLLYLHNQINQWVGCFGVCSIISHDFLKQIFEKYNFVDMLNHIKNRDTRCCLERIFALVCHLEYPELIHHPSLFGRIEGYMQPYTYFLGYDEYLQKIDEFTEYPIIKVWSGR